jgi:splicing factor 3B subunit 3
MLVLDYNTVVGADKFDNIFVLRIPPEVRDEQSSTGESTLGSGGLRLGPDTAYILGKNHKFDLVSSFHVGETVTSLQKVVMSPGAAEVIMYSTLSGSIGVMYPFSSKREYETLLALENQMRNEMHTSLLGRDHMQFRSYYLPVKAVVDGDLIASFARMKNRAEIAANVGKNVNEVMKIIEDLQNRIT